MKHGLWALFILKLSRMMGLCKQMTRFTCDLAQLKANTSGIETVSVSQLVGLFKQPRDDLGIYLTGTPGAPPAESNSGVSSPQHQMPGDLNFDLTVVGRPLHAHKTSHLLLPLHATCSSKRCAVILFSASTM